MKRVKRVVRKVFLVLVVLLLVLFGVYLLLQYYWGRQVNAQIAALRAAGHPTTIEEWEKTSVPAKDNAAPIYRRAFKALSEPTARRDLELLWPVLASNSKAPSANDWAKATSALARCDGAFALIAEAQSKPKCQFAPSPLVDQTSRKSFERSMALSKERVTLYSGLRDATRLLCGRVLISAHEGKTQDAVKYTESALKLSDAFDGKTQPIDYLTNTAVIRIVLANTKQALDYGQPSESELRQLDSAFSRINMPERYQTAVEGERSFFLLQNQQLRKARFTYPVTGDELAYLGFVSKHLESTQMSYSAARSRGLIGPNAADNIPFYACITKTMAPVLASAASNRYKCEAEIACCRAFLGLRAYKERFGEYPQSLAELKSGVGWDVPADPFTGKGLVYKRVGDGFVVYSLGYDLKDNGGTPLKQDGSPEPHGDIVWETDD